MGWRGTGIVGRALAVPSLPLASWANLAPRKLGRARSGERNVLAVRDGDEDFAASAKLARPYGRGSLSWRVGWRPLAGRPGMLNGCAFLAPYGRPNQPRGKFGPTAA